MTDKTSPYLFPEPQQMNLLGGEVSVDSNWQIVVDKDASEMVWNGAKELAACIQEASHVELDVVETDHVRDRTNVMLLGESFQELAQPVWENDHPEGYVLEAKGERIILAGNRPAGTYYAVQTLKQLLRPEQGKVAVPQVLIRDWPDMAYRGLFMEDKWGPDRMTLEDWKELIDFMAAHKLNLLGVGVYGCWCVQYRGQITEFWMLPIEGYPELKTPKTITYYSPAEKTWKEVTYLPRMFEEDFFGEVIAYGKQHNVIVRPNFNTLGHNTLIPRTYPEVSSIGEDGKPTGYGFCLSNPKTYEMLFNIFDQIIDRYLAPNGIDFFHIEMDEVYNILGADPKAPHREVDPWCKCPACTKVSREEQLVEHVLTLAEHLKAKGMRKISMWNDQLARHMDLMNEALCQRMKDRGVFENMAINWWWYSPKVPETIRPELGLTTWVTPMTGYFFWRYHQRYLENIYRMLQLGHEQGSEGTESYGVYDYGYHRNYCCISEYAWNKQATGDLDAFEEKYARRVFGADWEGGLAALRALDGVGFEDVHALMSTLIYYGYSYVNRNLSYPRSYPSEALFRLSRNREESVRKLRQIVDRVCEAETFFLTHTGTEMGPSTSLRTSFPSLIDHYVAECKRITGLAKIFLRLLEIQDAYDSDDPAAQQTIPNKVAECAAIHEDTMRSMEQTKAHYLLPQTLRDLSFMKRFIEELSQRVQSGTGGKDLLLNTEPIAL